MNTAMTMDTNLAFALGGLAGNNAHGAGFLQAALDHDVKPMMISCTSGQIRWVYYYLNALQLADKTDVLRKTLDQALASVKKTGNLNADVALLGMVGVKNVFRPAYEHMVSDFLKNAGDVLSKMTQSKGNTLIADQLLSLIPGRTLVPTSDDAYLADIVKVFNESSIGITFNAYNPQEGLEYVYLNDKARELLHDPESPEKYKHNQCNEHRPYRFYKNIDIDAVKDALWLYQYGFYEKETKFVDGAYFRDMMLAELVVADLIFSVRPINHKWIGELPRTYQAVEDLKTEVGFNGTYSAERDQITLINHLLAKKHLAAGKGRDFHHVDLVEIEIATQRGYFDYMLESADVFESARKMSADKFTELRASQKIS
jgi:hypothetical protein